MEEKERYELFGEHCIKDNISLLKIFDTFTTFFQLLLYLIKNLLKLQEFQDMQLFSISIGKIDQIKSLKGEE